MFVLDHLKLKPLTHVGKLVILAEPGKFNFRLPFYNLCTKKFKLPTHSIDFHLYFDVKMVLCYLGYV